MNNETFKYLTVPKSLFKEGARIIVSTLAVGPRIVGLAKPNFNIRGHYKSTHYGFRVKSLK